MASAHARYLVFPRLQLASSVPVKLIYLCRSELKLVLSFSSANIEVQESYRWLHALKI